MTARPGLQPTNPASTLDDVIRCIEDIFSGIGDATPIQYGKEYLATFGTGTPPKILFVDDAKGSLTDPPEGSGGMRFEAGIAIGCNVYVRAAEGGGDLGRRDAVNTLTARVISAIGRAARGRWQGRDFADDSPSGVDAYGADRAFSFIYTYGVQSDPAVWALPANPIAPSPPNISAPPGSPPGSPVIVTTVTPQL